MLEGREFTILTDHKPLTHALFRFSPSLSKFQVTCLSVLEMKTKPSISVMWNRKPLVWNFEWFSSPHGPLLLQNQFFIQFHNISHPGVWALRMIIYTIVWPRMSRDIGLWARSCLSYQRSKITHFYSPVPSTPVSTLRFSHVHVDIVGPLPSNLGYIYLLTMMDRTTRWPEVVP